MISLSHAQVPWPKSLKAGVWSEGERIMNEVRNTEPSFAPQVEAFVEALRKLGAEKVKMVSEGGQVVFSKGGMKAGSSYEITTAGNSLEVMAGSPEGAAQAAATLLQVVTTLNQNASWLMVNIKDGADHPYRSFMIDMGRNPHSPKVVRQVVDMMWLCKANYLHLHLTDDQLFSWPSTAFPKLYSERAGWTLEDFRELEEYSQARGVTIIPEIDVPGHSTILRQHYPEVFGKSPTELATTPEAQKGMETLIKEMLSVFKATPYFHMGGDEAYGVLQEAQRDFINRMNAFIKSQGKRTVVWEGPHLGVGENKVAEDVLHINWRCIEFPVQAMLDAGYEVVNAPWDPLYVVDHYPRTMFTAVDVERCYNLNVQRSAHINHQMATFKSPHLTKSAEGILGFCMPWWEGREENIIPLCFPRFTAAASAAWNRKGEKDFAVFQKRQARLTKVFEKISGYTFEPMPVADAAIQKDNLAYLGKVTPSDGASQPHFGPQRLTNGIPDRFDHFLGFPTEPKPLEIVIELPKKSEVGRIRVHETAVGESFEKYKLLVSEDGKTYTMISESKEGTRGEESYVDHKFERRPVKFILVVTGGCQNLTFPSFSRLTEVAAYRE
ncbi:family 20 glycosylhydrolase [Akkermansiaceae bacterium]|nr:family 20 glycosylhydrolase [Akkermansiaceae bacterium]